MSTRPRRIAAALALLLCTLPSGPLRAVEKTTTLPGTGTVQVGGKAPPLSSWDTEDSLVRLHDILGDPGTRAVLVSFYTSWCKECPKGLAMLQEDRSRLSKAGVRVLLVNHGEDAETIRDHRKRTGLGLPTVADEFRQIGRAYGVRFVPVSFLVGRDGTVLEIYTHEGDDFVKRILDDTPRSP